MTDIKIGSSLAHAWLCPVSRLTLVAQAGEQCVGRQNITKGGSEQTLF